MDLILNRYRNLTVLLVAILALLFFNYFQVKIGNLDTQLRVGLGRFVEAGVRSLAPESAGGMHGAR